MAGAATSKASPPGGRGPSCRQGTRDLVSPSRCPVRQGGAGASRGRSQDRHGAAAADCRRSPAHLPAGAVGSDAPGPAGWRREAGAAVVLANLRHLSRVWSVLPAGGRSQRRARGLLGDADAAVQQPGPAGGTRAGGDDPPAGDGKAFPGGLRWRQGGLRAGHSKVP